MKKFNVRSKNILWSSKFGQSSKQNSGVRLDCSVFWEIKLLKETGHKNVERTWYYLANFVLLVLLNNHLPKHLAI